MIEFLWEWRYTIAWTIWVAWFIFVEVCAIVDPDTGDTLSEHVWFLLRPWPVWFVFAGFLAWLLIHLLTYGRV